MHKHVSGEVSEHPACNLVPDTPPQTLFSCSIRERSIHLPRIHPPQCPRSLSHPPTSRCSFYPHTCTGHSPPQTKGRQKIYSLLEHKFPLPQNPSSEYCSGSTTSPHSLLRGPLCCRIALTVVQHGYPNCVTSIKGPGIYPTRPTASPKLGAKPASPHCAALAIPQAGSLHCATPWLSPESLPKALGLLELSRFRIEEERGRKAIMHFYVTHYVATAQRR